MGTAELIGTSDEILGHHGLCMFCGPMCSYSSHDSMCVLSTLSRPRVLGLRLTKKILNHIWQNCQKQTAPLGSTAQQLSFEWSHTRLNF